MFCICPDDYAGAERLLRGDLATPGSDPSVGGNLTLAQKQEMIRRVTVPPGAWGVGGQPVTDEDLRTLARQAPAA
jgi:hypothetical protein